MGREGHFRRATTLFAPAAAGKRARPGVLQ
jgi:hypothetical protein